jgi:hypothetical protein
MPISILKIVTIRWKNTLVKPNSNSNFMLFVCKYPVLFLIPVLLLSGFGYYFWLILTEMESGERESVYVGKLKIMYDLFGKWGIVGVFIFLAFCASYLFCIYAIVEPKKNLEA